MNPALTLNPGCSFMVNNIDEERLLLSHLKPNMRVLEFGLGLSSNVIAKLVREVVSIEHNVDWYNEFKPHASSNVIPVLVPANRPPSPMYDDGTFEDFEKYVLSPVHYAGPDKFDVVFIDGRARVACAQQAAKNYLKPGGLIFIHDYFHPEPQYRRREYEVVENFLTKRRQVFTMACFTRKGENSPYLMEESAQDNIVDLPEIGENSTPATSTAANIVDIPPLDEPPTQISSSNSPSVDRSTCWYQDYVVDEMNRFFDNHIRNHEITRHMRPLTDLLAMIDSTENRELLDLGCGTGMMTEFCKEFKYTGADLPKVIAGCAMRNFPNHNYRGCDIVEQDLLWIGDYDVIVLNGVIDIMQHPVETLHKILLAAKKYVLIHRQEITEDGDTRVIKNGSYGGETYHSIIKRWTFEGIVKEDGFNIFAETRCEFSNWENGGASFLLVKN